MKKVFTLLGLLFFNRLGGAELMDQVAPFSPLKIERVEHTTGKEYSRFLKLRLGDIKPNLCWEDDLITWKKISLHIDLPQNSLADHGEVGAIQSFRLEFSKRKLGKLSFGCFFHQHIPQSDPYWTGRQNYETIFGAFLGRI